MISISYKNIIKLLLITAVLVIFTIPDILLELIVEGIHLIIESIAEMAHLIFEGVESMLDNVIEENFHTEMHETQIVVFYIIMSVLCIPMYFIARVLPRVYNALDRSVSGVWSTQKSNLQMTWLGLSLQEKIKYGLILIAGLYIASFFVM
jgi:hypothetical protein